MEQARLAVWGVTASVPYLFASKVFIKQRSEERPL